MMKPFTTIKNTLRDGFYLSYVLGLFVIIEMIEFLKTLQGKKYALKSRQSKNWQIRPNRF